MTGTNAQDDLRDWVASRDWYHTLELAPGLLTPGWFDLRDIADQVPWPTLTGKRCLDVGTFDGFWALQMERRGAAEVVAVDELDPDRWDWPSDAPLSVRAEIASRHQGAAGFARVKEVLGSNVQHVHCNIYDLDPSVVGTFDVVYVGSLLLHLRDPIRGLERVRTVCKPGARVIMFDAIDLELTLAFPRRPLAQLDGLARPWWWKPNLAGLARMVQSAGFRIVGTPKRMFLTPGRGQPTGRPSPRELLHLPGRENLVMHWKGDPHGLVAAEAP